MRRIATILALLALILVSSVTSAEPAEDERFMIHVMTIGPGEELFARFGHIMLMIEDREARTQRVYNFGTFNFADPELRFKYARGFITNRLWVYPYTWMVRRYRHANREMVIRELDLTEKQTADIVRRLEINAQPENREYAYRHYLDNCCTRIRDLLDDVTGGAISRGRRNAPTGRTYRYWTKSALSGLPLIGTAILFSLGPAIDKPITRWDEHFLPSVLTEDLDATRMERRPLVKNKRTIMERSGPPPGNSIDTADIMLFAIGLGILIVGFVLPLVIGRRPLSTRLLGVGLAFWGLLAGLGGLILVLFWTVTEHTDTYWNENLLVMPVTHLWLVVPGVNLLVNARLGRKMSLLLRSYLFVASAMIVLNVILKLGPFIQDNWIFIAFAAAANAAALCVSARGI